MLLLQHLLLLRVGLVRVRLIRRQLRFEGRWGGGDVPSRPSTPPPPPPPPLPPHHLGRPIATPLLLLAGSHGRRLAVLLGLVLGPALGAAHVALCRLFHVRSAGLLEFLGESGELEGGAVGQVPQPREVVESGSRVHMGVAPKCLKS